MSIGKIEVKLRPTKLAILIKHNDFKSLKTAIEINSFLWGGRFNPIIPIFKYIPKIWQEKHSINRKRKNLIEGYIDAFDPDFIIKDKNLLIDDININGRIVLNICDIKNEILKKNTSSYGIGIFEILNYIIQKEFKFKRTVPLNICFPKIKQNNNLFLGSILGILPTVSQKLLEDKFQKPLAATIEYYDETNYTNILSNNNISVQELLLDKIKVFRNWYSIKGNAIFVINNKNMLDIIDYWNLRAIGWNILPISYQSIDNQEVLNAIIKFIENIYQPLEGNSKIYRISSLLMGRSLPREKLELCYKKISANLESPKNKKDAKVSMHPWYPRLWNNTYRQYDNVLCCDIESDSKDIDIKDGQDFYSFDALESSFLTNRVYTGGVKYVNDIKFHYYYTKENVAAFIPQIDNPYISDIKYFTQDSYRLGRKSVVFLPQYSKSIHIEIPKAEDVFFAWLRSKGWEVSLSTPGKTAKQMLNKLGGIQSISKIASLEIIKLINNISGLRYIKKEEENGKSIKEVDYEKCMKEEKLWSELKRIANSRKLKKDPQVIFSDLVSSEILKLGITIQCTVCNRHPWYPINNLDYEINCTYCAEKFKIPLLSNKRKWAYKTIGTFNIHNYAEGAYTTLLTLRFFNELCHGNIVAVTSFNLSKNDVKLESDFGIFLQQKGFASHKEFIAFGECKSFNSFDSEDIKKINILSDNFPGAIIVFSTLKPELSLAEKKLLRIVANKGRKLWNIDHPRNPVLILTSTELFAEFNLDMAWQDAGGRHSKFAKSGQFDNLINLCEITQELYLDLEPEFKKFESKMQKKKQQRNN